MNPTASNVYDFVLDTIVTGKVGEHELLPTETALAAKLGVSRMDAHTAIKVLERHSIVRSRRGVGTVVHKRPSPALVRYLKGLSAKRVHVVVGFEPVPLHWTEATVRQLEQLMGEEGYVVSHVPIRSPFTRASLELMLKEITSQGSSALVLILPEEASQFCQQNASLIFQYHRSVFLFDRGDTPPEGWPFHVISLDPFAEGVLAAEYLYEKGYRRLAYWSSCFERRYWSTQRANGFALGVQRASAGALTAEVWEYGGQAGAEQVCQKVRESDRPCAVAAANDEAASWLIDAAAARGLHAPGDFGLIGFDDNPLFRHHNLTTIAPPLANIGEFLAQVICGKLLTLEDFSSLVLRVPSHLVERDSCAAVAVSAPGGTQTLRQRRQRGVQLAGRINGRGL